MSVPVPHPRHVFSYLGGEAAEAAFLSALARGRLHHAWLLVGPVGVGKATFAYRAARRLLGAAPDPGFGRLGSHPDDPVCRQIGARGHPDLLVLQRLAEDGKTRSGIPAEEARALPEFFAKTPAAAPYRVAIIDAADDLNDHAANAVLKTLEEPSARGILFLVSHAPGALLPTLRSRCRRLRFETPPAEAAAALVGEGLGLGDDEARALLDLAGGAPGRAMRLADEGALEADRLAREILERLPGCDDAALLAATEGFRGPAGAAQFKLVFERLAAGVWARALDAANAGAVAERWAEVWPLLIELPRQAETINLDRADIFHTALGRLRAAARRPC